MKLNNTKESDLVYRPSADDTFCKSQLITCSRVKECNGVCPFEDALKHADKTQTMDEQHIVNHDREWIIGCIEHDGFIHTHRFDKANQIIHDALSAEAVQGWIPLSHDDNSLVTDFPHERDGEWVIVTDGKTISVERIKKDAYDHFFPNGRWFELEDVIAWMPLPEPYKGGDDE